MEIFDLIDYSVLNPNEKTLVFEAFSGIGTQAMAFDYDDIDFEIVGFSEIDKHAITAYHAIRGNHIKNYGDISKIKDLPKCHICTWSFPCTDISLAGEQKGMVEGTRSNYGYEFLETVKRSTHKPKILIMENVKNLISKDFMNDFKNILNILKSMGYENHWKVLNAKHYTVAQNRDRVFIVSILGGGWFQFPPKQKLTKRLKDYLEPVVDEKYYLSYKFVKGMMAKDTGKVNRLEQFMRSMKPTEEKTIASTITTRETNVATSNFILEPIVVDFKSSEKFTRKPSNEICPTLTTDARFHIIEPIAVEIRADEGIRTFKDNVMGTLRTTLNCGDKGVILSTNIQMDNLKAFDVIDIDGKAYIVGSDGKTLNRIRKLTPLECWRLMGIKDEDFYKAKNAGISNAQLYKQAGNAIVVDVLRAIFKNLF